ncbi:hypothetical protein [Absidia glauca]|uniref:Uncharacterized protein n=1 Tax=Absidia glauca TaxID=4829 RepID=A0A168KM99_ABSGL|nr:hypothetical protein [Absidia glauca]
MPLATSDTIATPFVDAYENVSKDFDQFYDYISNVMSPRRTQSQRTVNNSSNKVIKTAPKNTTRINQELDRRRNLNSKSSQLTPLMERHSLTASSREDYPTNRYIGSPTSNSRRRSQQDYPPPRPMTLTPNTIRTTSSRGICFQQDDSEEESDHTKNVYIDSPHRATGSGIPTTTKTPIRMFDYSPIKRTADDLATDCPPSPSLVLHNHLLDESRRLEQLQRNVLLVQQQSLALSNSGASSTSRQLFQHATEHLDLSYKHPTDMLKSPYPSHRRDMWSYHQTSSIPARTLSHRSRESPASSSSNVPSHHHQQRYSSTQLKTIPKTTENSVKEKAHQSPPAKSHHVSLHPTHLSRQEESAQQKQPPQNSMEELLSDIPKAQLRPTKTVTTPNGSRIKNRFWEEIHDSKTKSASPRHHLSHNPIQPTSRKRKSLDNDESFWIIAENDHGNDNYQQQQYIDRSIRQQHSKSSDGQVTTNQRTNEEKFHSPNAKLQRHYPADFFEELSHTLKNKPTNKTHDDL